jgi:hypothetical protein
MPYQPRDFIETAGGLIFAVVDGGLEDGRVLCFLRYLRENGVFRKLGTREANRTLSQQAPRYLFHSSRLAATLHGVPVAEIGRHYRPRERVAEIMRMAVRDVMQDKAVRWLELMAARGLDLGVVGITGSLLIGAQNPASDLDFVIYSREAFFKTRELMREAIASGELQALSGRDWREAHDRRGCALSFEDYLRHERRKFNKGLIDGVKFDITLIGEGEPQDQGPVRKLGRTLLRTKVIDASHAYDNPARYRLDDPEIREALSFTQTYAGQALTGERVEIAGIVEETEAGVKRVVVGSSREAPGEYIKVIGS